MVAIITVTAEKTIATTVTAVIAVGVAALVAAASAAITNITAAKTAAAVLRKRRGRDAQGKHRQGRGEAHQLPSQELPTSRRRSRAPLTPPVIIVACDEKASASPFGGSIQPLAVESMARWTSTRPTVRACHGSQEVCVGLASVCPAVDIGRALAAAGGLTQAWFPVAASRREHLLADSRWSETNRGERSVPGSAGGRKATDVSRATRRRMVPVV